MHVKNPAFVAGHCRCTLEGTDLVFNQGSAQERIPCPESLKSYFEVVHEMLAIVNIDENTGDAILEPCPWINLHVHTEYSLLDGAIKAPDLAKKIKSDGTYTYSPICAITDHGNMFGTYAFSQALVGANEKPIIGCEVYCQGTNGKNDNNHLILLCKNEKGYKNLCKILTEAEENFYRHANVTIESLKKYHEGLVCLSACLAGELARQILAGNDDKAYEFVETMLEIFDEDFYIEIQDHNLVEEMRARRGLIDIAEEFGVKIVATTDAHYLNKEDKHAHDVLLCIGTGKKLSDPSRFQFDGDGYHIMSNQEAYERFKKYPEAIMTQMEIAEKCEFVFKDTKVTMPVFEVPAPYTEREYFEKLCWDGFEERFKDKDINREEYTERLKYEIQVMTNMGFEGYFLIVQDFINWAKSNGIAIGPGRGSCVGSLAAYCMKITDLDPIPLELLFERFLNPERVSMPDIDVDIEDERRQEVIDYVSNKYGKDHVSRIITFGTLAARLVVRDVGRVLDANQFQLDTACKFIPAEPKMTITKALKESPDFKNIYDTNLEIKNVVDIALRLEGLARHKSQHACGVVIAKDPIDNTVPEVVLKDKTGVPAPTAAFNMVELENLGLLKMDFLGLRNMGIINNCCKTVGVKEETIDLYDPYVYEHISTGNTDGIFQIESPGMKSLMKDMFWDVTPRIKKYKATNDNDAMLALGHECFERLIAAISLYRPGPMDYIPDYVAGMRNPDKVHYDCPELKPILAKTYGVLVYQEQVQQICRSLAGYSYGRADVIRRAMGKKKQKVMDAEREVFIYGNAKTKKANEALVPGCVANGIPENIATVIWNKMAKFAEYAFNKSHSAGYSVISVRTAWFKHYYPKAFWTATLNSVLGKADKQKKYIASAAKDQIHILPPSINKSNLAFIADDAGIRMGLQALRNLGKSAVPILDERENGTFNGIADLLNRVAPDKSSIESMAYAGALDEFGLSRNAIISNMPAILDYKARLNKYDTWCDTDEIDAWYQEFMKLDIEDIPEMDKKFKLEQEYKYAGMYVTEHPLDQYSEMLNVFSHSDIEELVVDKSEEADDGDQYAFQEERKVVVVGILKEVTKRLTKKGDPMMTSFCEDKTGSIKVTVFPKQFEACQFVFVENEPVVIEGTWKSDDYGSQIIVEKAYPVGEMVLPEAGHLFILVNQDDVDKIVDEIVDNFAGPGPELCIRTVMGTGRSTMFYDMDEKKLVSGNYKALANNPSNAKIKLNFTSFSMIKEMVKDIAIRP